MPARPGRRSHQRRCTGTGSPGSRRGRPPLRLVAPSQREMQRTRTTPSWRPTASGAADRYPSPTTAHLTGRVSVCGGQLGNGGGSRPRRRIVQANAGGAPTSNAHQCSVLSYSQPRTTAGGCTASRREMTRPAAEAASGGVTISMALILAEIAPPEPLAFFRMEQARGGDPRGGRLDRAGTRTFR